jgi:hypothetical protein
MGTPEENRMAEFRSISESAKKVRTEGVVSSLEQIAANTAPAVPEPSAEQEV